MENHHLSKRLEDKTNEYDAIRNEITTWITVKYTLIVITASVTAISLGVLTKTSHWYWFSAAIISIVACLGFLTSHANSKITIAATYITIFHPDKTVWDHLIYEKLKRKFTLATIGYVLPLSGFYLVLLMYIIIYPAVLHDDLNFPGFKNASSVLGIPLLMYFFMIFSIWRSERREVYEKIWNEFMHDKN